MPQRTASEIKEQIQGLKDLRHNTNQYSDQGLDNWEIINAKIDILEGAKTIDEFDTDKYNYLEFEAAIEAMDWLHLREEFVGNLYDEI